MISYVIAILLGIANALFADNVDISNQIFQYRNFDNVGYLNYMILTMAEVLSPTTITFSGVILLQNRDNNSIQSTLVFILIVLLTILTIGLQVLNNLLEVSICGWIIMGAWIISIALTWSINDVEETIQNHKKEKSDGKMIS